MNLLSSFVNSEHALNDLLSLFFPDSIKMWNTIMPHFQDMPTLMELKKHLISLFRPKPKSIFNIYSPIGTKIIYQLRLGLSRLRNHKKNHNFLDTPSDICLCKNGIEDTHHFLLKCEFYSNHRTKMITKVTNILSENDLIHLNNSVQLYLYGDSSLSFAENREILSTTIEYIIDTNRFT